MLSHTHQLATTYSLCRYIQNTCVDPPHDKPVTSLSFRPATPPLGGASTASRDPAPVPLAVTTSSDQRFKVWVLVDPGEGEGEGEGEEGGKRGRKRVPASWACRSVGYYHQLQCQDAAFSQDGSLLAVNFSKVRPHPSV